MPALPASQRQIPNDEVFVQFGACLAHQLAPGLETTAVLLAIQRAVREYRAASAGAPATPLNGSKPMELVFVHDCRWLRLTLSLAPSLLVPAVAHAHSVTQVSILEQNFARNARKTVLGHKSFHLAWIVLLGAHLRLRITGFSVYVWGRFLVCAQSPSSPQPLLPFQLAFLHRVRWLLIFCAS